MKIRFYTINNKKWTPSPPKAPGCKVVNKTWAPPRWRGLVWLWRGGGRGYRCQKHQPYSANGAESEFEPRRTGRANPNNLSDSASTVCSLDKFQDKVSPSPALYTVFSSPLKGGGGGNVSKTHAMILLHHSIPVHE